MLAGVRRRAGTLLFGDLILWTRDVLRERHKIQFRDEDDFTLVTQNDLISAFGEVTGVLGFGSNPGFPLNSGLATLNNLIDPDSASNPNFATTTGGNGIAGVFQGTNGTAIVNLRLATSESWRDKQSGERKERTEWHRVSITKKARDLWRQ